MSSEIVVDELSKGFKVETVRSTSIGGNSFSSSSRAPKMVGYGKYSSAKRTPVRTADLDEKFANFGLSESRPPLISFFPPEAGMFVWVSSIPSAIPRHMLFHLWAEFLNRIGIYTCQKSQEV